MQGFTLQIPARPVAVLFIILVACREAAPPEKRSEAAPAPAAAASVATPVSLASSGPLASYADSAIPTGPMGVSIRRGLALVEHTPDSLPAYVGSGLRCTSCHLDKGQRPNAAPLIGAYTRYPRYIERVGAVVPIEDRVNYCITRSLAGRALPTRSQEMVDIVAFLSFLSRGVSPGEKVAGEGMPKMPALAGDSARGRELFASSCVRCHGPDGGGIAMVPALWGPRSYSIGASMARVERAASFVRHNMPLDRPGTLTDQQAYDVAAYINAFPRPDMPGKGLDWPNGDAPADVPYATKGHQPTKRLSVLARRRNDGVLVPAPITARGRSDR
jgi:thiosulfate dehydrogenase